MRLFNRMATDRPEAGSPSIRRATFEPKLVLEQKLVLTDEDALWAIPRYSIACTESLATRGRALMATYRDAGRLWDVDTGHDLMITEPQAVADALLAIAADPDRSPTPLPG